MSLFDPDGIAPKIRALYNTFLNWSQAEADDVLAKVTTNLDAPVSGAGGGTRRVVKLTAGSGNWVHPANIKDDFVCITLVAAGGAGGRDSTAGEGGAGGGGGEILYRVPLFLSGSQTAYVVAAQTAGRATDGLGADGADTTFGTLVAQGGKGGGSSAGGSPPPAGAGGGIYGGTGGGVQASNGSELGWRIGGGEGGNGDDANGQQPQAGGKSISGGGAADLAGNSGGGGGSWGAGGPGVGTGGGGADGTDGGGGGGCNSGTSGAGGAGFILIEYEEEGGSGGGGGGNPVESIIIAVGDETTAAAVGTNKVRFRMPYGFTLSEVRASLNDAPVGSTFVIDINEGGASILSTKLSIDAGETTSTTATTPAVISDSALADDAEISIDIDQVGSTTAGKGLKVTLIGVKT